MFQLKSYQERTLESLRLYLKACDDLQDADAAFYQVTRQLWDRGIPYRPIETPLELADIPYVCLRLPTGGGKTLLACHAVAIANKEYLKRENSFILWLVPSNAIKEQTLKALKDRNHEYRQALESTLTRVTIMDLSEALYLQAGVILGSTVIIVATLQAFRVEDREGRKVYESSGTLQHHFNGLPSEIQEILDKNGDGIISYSLSNVMRIHRPLVIVDEAHNARTNLSLDVLGRFRPSAIIEFTATPDKSKNPSNVLHSVSAAELKAENMIKLPIRLETKINWQALLSDAIIQRIDLETKAKKERQTTGDYIRPVMLIQAQPRRQEKETLTVDAIEKALVKDHHISENQIARATGEDRELEGIDLKDEKCEIRYIITVQALREGWDCPFAYILYSVAEQRSLGAVEQILGRILRLPYCKQKDTKELEIAYAFVTSANFAEAAQHLVDALIENGFNRQEAEEFVKPAESGEERLPLPPFHYKSSNKTIILSEAPDPCKLSDILREKVTINPNKNEITLKEPLSDQEVMAIGGMLSKEEDRNKWIYEAQLYRESGLQIFTSPSERGAIFQIPNLCIKRETQIELFEEDHLIEKGWSLREFNPTLTDLEFSILASERGEFGEIDVGIEGRIRSKFIPDLNRQLQLMCGVENWTDSELIYWLDKNLPFKEIVSQEKETFLTAMVGDLIDHRNIILGQLVRKKFELRKIAEEKIKCYRQQAKTNAYQELLFGEDSEQIVVSPERCFTFHPQQYPARDFCKVSDSFNKHYYPKVGELDDKGEEYLCAQFIDQMPEVEFWVRNLERREKFSFWLQTATDKFYPDFVCKLKDGRYLVVESKGADRWSDDDSKDKRRLGELWSLKSEGQCLFIMPKGKQWGLIKEVISK